MFLNDVYRNLPEEKRKLFQVDLPNNQKRTLLWLACNRDFRGIVTICLYWKANPYHRDRNGLSCFEAARSTSCRKQLRDGIKGNYSKPTNFGSLLEEQQALMH